LDCLQIPVNAGGDFSASRLLARNVFVDGLDFRQILVNQRQIFRLFFACAVRQCCFRCHSRRLIHGFMIAMG